MSAALLVIDFINDIVHPQGKLARYSERIVQNKIISHANQAIAHARKNNLLIIFVKVGFHPGYPECPKQSPLFGAAAVHQALLLNSWGTQFHEELHAKETDLILVKHRVSSFYATPLEALLRAQKIQSLILTGVATNMAIEHTARDGHDRDYEVTVISDACETINDEMHKASLETMSRFAKVTNIQSWLQV